MQVAEGNESSLTLLTKDQQNLFPNRRGIEPESNYKAISLIPPIKEFTEGNLLTDGTTADLCVSGQPNNEQMTHSRTIQYLLRINGARQVCSKNCTR